MDDAEVAEAEVEVVGCGPPSASRRAPWKPQTLETEPYVKVMPWIHPVPFGFSLRMQFVLWKSSSLFKDLEVLCKMDSNCKNYFPWFKNMAVPWRRMNVGMASFRTLALWVEAGGGCV